MPEKRESEQSSDMEADSCSPGLRSTQRTREELFEPRVKSFSVVTQKLLRHKASPFLSASAD